MNTSTSDIEVLDRLLAQRRSCRGFLPEQVPRETIEQWLHSSQRAASWCNTQPWQMVVTSGEATTRFRDEIVKRADAREPAQPDFPFPPEYQGVSLARRREVGFALYESVGVARGDREASARQARENFLLFGAPHVAILTTDASLGVYGAVDCGVYLGTLMLTAQALGLGLIAQAALARHPDFIRSHFGLSEDRRVVCGMSFGFPDRQHPANAFRSRRAGLDEVVSWVGG